MRFVAGLLSALLLLSGCAGVLPSTEPVPGTAITGSPSGSSPSSSGSSPDPSPSLPSPLAALTASTCTGAVSKGGEPSQTITTTNCSRTHYWEVAAVEPLTASEYPGEIALKAQATTACTKAFTSYVGVAVTSSPYTATFVAPSQTHWANPDARKLVCLVGSEAGGLTRSLKDHPVVFAETGQCLGKPVAGSPSNPLVSCATKHLYEVYAVAKVDGPKAPSAATLDGLYRKVCVAGFKKFVGLDQAKSKYEIQYFVLPSELWTKYSDHRLVCSAGSPYGGITGSLKGIKK